MAKSRYNVTPQKDLDLQTARKKMQSNQDVLNEINQDALNERFLRQKIDNTDDKMKLLRVYRTDRDLVISTSKGERYCRLSNAKFLNIDELERKCDQLIGLNVITTAK